MTARFLIRFDDVCPTMNWQIWDCVEPLLDRYRIKPIVAIVPDNRDPKLVCQEPRTDFWDRALSWQRRGWTIGLHGHQHLYTTSQGGILGIHAGSEFAGHDADTQRAKISAGVEIFRSHGLKPTVWVAPGHAFDETTLRILPEFNIRIISDGFYWRCIQKGGLFWVPQQLWRFRNLRFGLWTVCMHINSWNDRSIEKLERSLERFSSQFTDVEAALSSPPPPANGLDRLFEIMFGAIVRMKLRDT